MDQLFVLFIAICTSVSLLALISLGLTIIFGMMRIINFAHGEFIMLGGYATVLSAHNGVNIWIAMLVVAPATVAVVGLAAERLIRRFYGQTVMTLLATWGLSLFLIGTVTALFGNTTLGVAAPLGSVSVGSYSVSAYQLMLIVITFALVLASLLILNKTSWGLIARGTMQNPQAASTLGIDPGRVYAITFTAGAALTGLAGGLLAPMSGVIPHMGASYVARAFVTVISGGSGMVTGMVSAATLFGPIEAVLSFIATPVIGQAGLLVAAIILLRLMPEGISGRFQRRRL